MALSPITWTATRTVPGFPLNKTTQIDYNKFLATAAHQRGLIVALKNATDLVPSSDLI